MIHILMVSAEFYPEISEELKAGAKAELKKAKATYDLVVVPGAFEIPAVIGYAIAGKKYDGYIALGCVIRGETTHYDYVCGESARGLMELSIEKNAAIGYGILTVENMKQAKARAKVNKGNKGKDAAQACLRLIELKKKLCKA